MRKIELHNIVLVLMGIVALLILGINSATAQEPAPTVCRVGERYEFRNIPQAWLDAGSWWYVADGATLEGNTLIADGIPEADFYSDDVGIGEAVLGNMDYSVVLKGSADTILCDPPVEPTPEAPAPMPVSQIVVSTGRVCTVQYPEIILVCGS